MRVLYIVIAILFLAVAALTFLVLSPRSKSGYIYNSKVFEKFDGTVHLQAKLANQRKANKKVMDSLTTLIEKGRKDLENEYAVRANSLASSEAQLNEQYTADLWKFINEGVKEYGDQNNYDFIFGATGTGDLMYAREDLDLTEEVVKFLNDRYADRPR
jgi:outer membrane protein